MQLEILKLHQIMITGFAGSLIWFNFLIKTNLFQLHWLILVEAQGL
jgi:hypothetical protein